MFILTIISRFLYCLVISFIFKVFKVNKIWISYLVFPILLILYHIYLLKDSLAPKIVSVLFSYYIQEFVIILACQLIANYWIFRKIIKIENQSSEHDDTLDQDLMG